MLLHSSRVHITSLYISKYSVLPPPGLALSKTFNQLLQQLSHKSDLPSRMLPFSLGCAVMSIVSGIVVSRTGQYRPVMWVSYAIFAAGMGLMIMLGDDSTTYVRSSSETSSKLTVGESPVLKKYFIL